MANANSTPGFLKKLEFQRVAPLEAGVLLRARRGSRATTPTSASTGPRAASPGGWPIPPAGTVCATGPA
uniref:Uncharacterized protein n=1 Tax=Phenylobacterium glaciei TaxID=2803784 RepID=A0A974P3Y0_9CAUL|nr:hypothetical protein JKL49_24955 [Phenylobacterium glaciei]